MKHIVDRRTQLFTLLVSSWLACSSASGAPPNDVGEALVYTSGADALTGRLFRPAATGKHPAIVVIHEWWGLNDWTKARAAELARAGYVALAVDLYRGRSTDDRTVAHELHRGLPHDRALRDLSAAIAALTRRREVDASRVGVIGWCMGGGYAVELAAADPRVRATVVYYGALPSETKAIKAPLLGNFGADDKGIPAADVRAFESALKAQGTPVDIKIYPGAGHAFASGDATAFRSEAAKDADQRAHEFLRRTLHPERDAAASP